MNLIKNNSNNYKEILYRPSIDIQRKFISNWQNKIIGKDYEAKN
jgi:hypothetical protein